VYSFCVGVYVISVPGYNVDSSSIGLFVVLCRRPNNTNHDTQQDANGEEKVRS
jgi:hypothetical protein